MKSTRLHRIVRWIIQILFLLLFMILLLRTRFSIGPGHQNLFFRFDPLVFLIISITYRVVLSVAFLSVVIIVGALVFGRFFCGYICPLGACIDLADACTSHTSKHGIPRPQPGWLIRLTGIKYLFLIFLIASAVLGASFVHFGDPLVIVERALTFVLYPIISWIAGSIALIEPAYFTETLGALLVLLFIMCLSFLAHRFWCRVACPLGGMLAFISKWTMFKFTFLEECTTCGICEQVCPTSAIDCNSFQIDTAECISCFRCLYECPQQNIGYRFKPGYNATPFNIQRRQFFTAIAASIVAVPLSKSLLHTRLGERFIRPPGALPESDFINVCIRCGMCMKACPTNGLQPCVFEAGINGIWTPRLVPRIGACEKNCNLCGQICPTSAIRKLPLEEKTYVKIGTAVIDRSRCIAWEQDKVCLICDEACPFNAISSFSETIRNTTLLRPYVDERICTGCGLCETQCPIEGPAAIQVYSLGEERIRTGSYITEEKVRLRACEDKPEDLPSGFIIEE
jgi:MauM/NapG family ferredoxin protein